MMYCKKCNTRYLSHSGNCPLCKKKGDQYDDRE